MDMTIKILAVVESFYNTVTLQKLERKRKNKRKKEEKNVVNKYIYVYI
jgi:hypothetical protein